MKRGIAVSVVLALVGATLAVAVPAQASDVPPWPYECLFEGPNGPGTQSVYTDSEGRLILNPEAAPDDVIAYAQWGPEKLLAMYPCLTEKIWTESVVCTYDTVGGIASSLDPVNGYLRYVYPNPNGPGVAVDTPLLVADAAALVDCSVTSVRP